MRTPRIMMRNAIVRIIAIVVDCDGVDITVALPPEYGAGWLKRG